MQKRLLILGLTAILFLISASLAYALASHCVTYQEARANPNLKGQTDGQLRAMGFCPGEEAAPSEETEEAPEETEAPTETQTYSEPQVPTLPGEASQPTAAAPAQAEEIDWESKIQEAMNRISTESSQWSTAVTLLQDYRNEHAKDLSATMGESFATLDSSQCSASCNTKFPHIDVDPDTFRNNYPRYQKCVDDCGKEGRVRSDKVYQDFEERIRQRAEKLIAALNALGGGLTPQEQQAQSGDSWQLGQGMFPSDPHHQQEMQSLQSFYSQPMYPGDPADQKGGKMKLDESRPIGTEMLDAKFKYEDAINKGASREELDRLLADYKNKKDALKASLIGVLETDMGNVDAMWQLGTLHRWEGDEGSSYEDYRSALSRLQHSDPFKYNELLDRVRDPIMRENLVQSLNPKEKVMTLPTIDTSPLLKALDNSLNTLISPLDDKVKQTAKDVEKLARSLSITNILDQASKELDIYPVGENDG
jgi:hypothetical protein